MAVFPSLGVVGIASSSLFARFYLVLSVGNLGGRTPHTKKTGVTPNSAGSVLTRSGDSPTNNDVAQFPGASTLIAQKVCACLTTRASMQLNTARGMSLSGTPRHTLEQGMLLVQSVVIPYYVLMPTVLIQTSATLRGTSFLSVRVATKKSTTG
jgi:hypothetical protein